MFMEFNKLTMLTLKMRLEKKNYHCNAMWRQIVQMRNLKVLCFSIWEENVEYEPIPKFGKGVLPSLEHISLEYPGDREMGNRDFLKSLDGSKLKTLRLYGAPFDIRGIIDARMRHVWQIFFNSKPSAKWQPHRETLFLLPRLKVLGLDPEDSDILPLIKGLPRLEELWTEEKIGVDALISIHNYCAQTQRKIVIDVFDGPFIQ